MAPLQKRAWWGFITAIVFIIAFILVFFLMGGIDKFDRDVIFRLIIDVLIIGGLLANLFILNVSLKKPGMMDERDRVIAGRAPRMQWLAVIFTLVAWVIGLNEAYQETNLIPAVFLYIIFMSVLIVSTMAQCLGILVGYWSMNRNA